MNFEHFSRVFNKIIFDTSKADLLKKVSQYPDRYVGIFRPTKPKAKLLQNLLQSNEIRFGDAFEKIIEEYFVLNGYELLNKKIFFTENEETRELNLDQFIKKDNQIVFIEQKVRDDHDSSKKRGQIENFETKLNAIIREYGDKNIKAFFYFIDPSLVKNRNYYSTKLIQLSNDYGISCIVSYGEELFAELDIRESWYEILEHLKKWKDNIQELPETNFDLEANTTFEEIKDLPPKFFRALFNNQEIKKQILPVLFPQNKTLKLLSEYFGQKEEIIYLNLKSVIDAYIK